MDSEISTKCKVRSEKYGFTYHFSLTSYYLFRN